MKLLKKMLQSKLARLVLFVTVLVLLSVAVWVAGPILAYGGYAPLAGFWTRLVILILIWGTFFTVVGVRFYRKRKAEKALEDAVTGGDVVTGDADELSNRMTDAIATLRKASGGRDFLYDLPWYVIIGPPGAGKTTALVNSGLKFPLASEGGIAAIAGVGGTRYCDWWFSEDAVLIDTAGRYTTQDSNKEADEKSWFSFLDLLKTNRPKQPINGVIIAISLEDIITLPEREVAEHATAIRKRLLELHEKLKIDFPVYALFTKADLIAGFNEFFSSFPEDRRRQVWGATFQTDDRRKNSVTTIPAEFDDLIERLTEETADRLQSEPDPMARIAIFGFPAQVARLRDPVATFLQSIFEPTRYHANAHLRGFYFSSGTQQGTPIDQVLGVMGQGLRNDASSVMSGRGRSYFLHDLLTKVIFQEAGWVSYDRKAVRRDRTLYYGALTAMAVVTIALTAVWTWSYVSSRELVAATERSIAQYRTIGGPALDGDVVADHDLEKVVGLLDNIRNLEGGYVNRGRGGDWHEGFGLSQRDRITVAGVEAYREALERTFRSRLIYRLEQQIEERLDDPSFVYEALKVYLMLGGAAPIIDDEFIIRWEVGDWEQNLYRGAPYRGLRANLEQHLRAMLELDDTQPTKIQLNESLITSARQTLVRLPLAERAFSMLSAQAAIEGLRDWSLVDAGGLDTVNVFETLDGTPIEDITVSGLYTYSGFHDFFLARLAEVADNLDQENWVLQGEETEGVTEAQFASLGRDLLERYRRDFVRAWEDMFGKIRLKRMSADKPQYQTIAAASSANSPIRNLVASISHETKLTEDAGGATVAEGDPSGGAQGLAGEVAEIAVQRFRDRSTGWTRIGINLALEKSQSRLGGNSGGSRQIVPGEEIELYFRPWHQLSEGDPGRRPVDLLISNLYDIYQSLLLAVTNPSQLDYAMKNLSLQINSLRVNTSRLPRPLQAMMESAVRDFEGDAVGSTISQINQALNSEVTRTCQDITANRYPFANSNREVQMTEFGHLFGPNGVLDRFLTTRLAQYVDMSGEVWDWKSEELIGTEMSKATLREFQRAAEIRDAYFPSGSQLVGFDMVVRPVSLSGTAELALLEINGSVVQSQQVGNAPANVRWPGIGAGSASITLLPELPGRKSNIAAGGQWAFLRLLAKGSVAQTSEGISVRFVIDGREASYKIDVNSLRNPFLLPALQQFKCPASF